ncbi:MAG: hypothetical protein IJY96_08155 [Oscillospiraceae bacterium]|nr:hypothetical protein [Oscillospiraceae bacterium]
MLYGRKDFGDKRNLFRLLKETPIDIKKLKKELQSGNYSAEDVTKAALQYLGDCFDEQTERDWGDGNERAHSVEAAVCPEMRSSALLEVIRLLLEYGLDPNAVYYDSENVMNSLRYIDNGYLAADALALLFEDGGRHTTLLDGEDLFNLIDSEVIFDAVEQENRRKYDSLVHCWFVYLGYGAKPQNGATALDVFHGFDISELRDHRRFTFALSHTPNRGENWTLHIIDRCTFWEVARL